MLEGIGVEEVTYFLADEVNLFEVLVAGNELLCREVIVQSIIRLYELDIGVVVVGPQEGEGSGLPKGLYLEWQLRLL